MKSINAVRQSRTAITAGQRRPSCPRGDTASGAHKIARGLDIPFFLLNPTNAIDRGRQIPSSFVPKNAGQPLSSSMRRDFEPRLGRDLSRVRVHADHDAAESARALHAKAYTTGTHIVFGEGSYRPDTRDGKRLLAHELAHVVQQASGLAPRSSSPNAPVLTTPAHPSEREADRQAETLLQHDAHHRLRASDSRRSASEQHGTHMTGRPLNPSPGLTIQRQEEESWQLDLLPPRLSGPLGPLSFSATTSAAQLGYSSDAFRAGLGYRYGGDIFATGRYGDLSGRLGINPESGAFSLGGSYDQFRFGLRGSPSGAFGASLGYGAPLLPLPSELSSTVYGGAAGLHGVIGSMPEFLQNPLETYGAQRENIDAMIAAGRMLGRIAGQEPGGPNFGVGVRVGWDPQRGLVFFGGMQGSF